MVNKKGYTPQHCFHKRSGLGYVQLNGRQFYTAAWGTTEARLKADELLERWLANGRRLPPQMQPTVYRVQDLTAEFWVWAIEHYRKNGKLTGETNNIRDVIRPLLQLFGSKPADRFGPANLEALQRHLVEQGNWARTTINARVNIVKRIFRWGTRKERLSGNTSHALAAVPALQKTRTAAREPEPITGISEAAMLAVLPHVPPPVAAMIALQWHTGMRPGEVTQMRWKDIDRRGSEWCYRPWTHKLEHFGKDRRVWLGPKAQAVLHRWLRVDPGAFLFSPRESELARRAALQAERTRPMTPAQRRRDATRQRRSPLKGWYTTNNYRQAITRGCDSAGIPRWTPNQLRHAACERFRAAGGLDAAQAVLGHAHASTTELYAGIEDSKARAVVHQLG